MFCLYYPALDQLTGPNWMRSSNWKKTADKVQGVGASREICVRANKSKIVRIRGNFNCDYVALGGTDRVSCNCISPDCRLLHQRANVCSHYTGDGLD